MCSAVGSYKSFRGHAACILRVEDGGNWCLQNTGKQIVQCHIPEDQILKYKNHVLCLLASPHSTVSTRPLLYAVIHRLTPHTLACNGKFVEKRVQTFFEYSHNSLTSKKN